MTRVTERRTKVDWAHFLADIAERYADATRISRDQPLTAPAPSTRLSAAQAKALWDRFDSSTPPSMRLNVAEVELGTASPGRIDSIGGSPPGRPNDRLTGSSPPTRPRQAEASLYDIE